ncbi:MAG: hypothetical protein ACE5FJ_02145 [Gemmatimonadales bacterium]
MNMAANNKPLVWLDGEVQGRQDGKAARRQGGKAARRQGKCITPSNI